MKEKSGKLCPYCREAELNIQKWGDDDIFLDCPKCHWNTIENKKILEQLKDYKEEDKK
jgi:Zn ribbon nucleic-acid-binding protein